MHTILLPLNHDPSLKSYTHNAYTNSILSSQMVGGEIAARYEINSDVNEFQVIEANCATHIEQDVTVKASAMHENGYSVIHRKCSPKDSMVLKVNSRRCISAWELIGIILSDAIEHENAALDACVLKFGCPSGQKLFIQRKSAFLAHDGCPRIYASSYYLRLVRDELDIVCSYSLDGRKWFDVYEDKLPAKYKFAPLSIGVTVETRNDYMNWVCSNYIQLYAKYPCPGLLMIDYYTGPSKSYKTYYTNQFLDFTHEFYDTSSLSPRKFRNIIYSKLLEQNYIITEIDHFYVPKTPSYQRVHFFHEVMIYGIDMKNRTYHIMAYGNMGIVFTLEIKFHALYQSLKKDELRFILGRVNVNCNNYSINTFAIKKHLRDYLNGYNCEMDVSGLVTHLKELAYGIQIIRHIVENQDELYLFCTDTRLSYVFYEHKNLMLQRILYLRANGVLTCDEYPQILEMLETNVKITEIVKNTILRNAVKYKNKSSLQKIKKYLIELADNEKTVYEKIIDVL